MVQVERVGDRWVCLEILDFLDARNLSPFGERTLSSPPILLSQDFNICSRNFTDGAELRVLWGRITIRSGKGDGLLSKGVLCTVTVVTVLLALVSPPNTAG
jgi:hypothetical protein